MDPCHREACLAQYGARRTRGVHLVYGVSCLSMVLTVLMVFA